MDVVLLTRQSRPFDRMLAGAFLREGYRVFAVDAPTSDDAAMRDADDAMTTDGPNVAEAGVTLLSGDFAQIAKTIEKDAGKIDIYVELSDERSEGDHFTIRDTMDEDVIRNIYEENVLHPMAALEAFIHLLDAGGGKRLCFITSSEGSINETRAVDGYGYALSKAAMSNFYQMISNKLTPKGYTFRVFDPLEGEVESEAAAEGAFNYFVRRRGTENMNPLRDDETRLVFRDALGREHTW